MNILKKIEFFINAWDPINLLALGAPQDEYNLEIYCIFLWYIKFNNDNLSLGEIIYETFTYMFEECFDSHKEVCYQIASLILN